MAITINGSGTVTGITAGGLPDGVITTDDLAANAVTTAKLGTDEASGLCKAWVNFNGSGTVAIRESYNVSSITDNGTGDYTVNFATALVDANYSVVATSNINATGSGNRIVSVPFSEVPTTSTVRLTCSRADTTTVEDPVFVHVAVFR